MGAGADATSTYAVDLEDGTSGPAEAAAKALERLQRRLKDDTSALGKMNAAMRNLKGATTPNLDAIRKLTERIAEQKGKIAEGQAAFLQLGGSFKAARKPPTDALAAFGKQAQAMPGPLGGLVSRLSSLKSMLAGNLMRLAIVGVVAALAALAAAAVVAAVALAKYGIAAANARRNELLHLQGLTKMRNWWGVAAGSATEMQGAIDRVSGSTSLGREKITQYAGELYRLHLRGENLSLALEAAAIKGAVLGDEGARSAMQWAAGMNMAGKSVKRLTDDVKARFGPTAAAMMLDLNVQSQKLRESFGALFANLKIEGLLKAISGVTGLFSQSTRSGQALRAIMTTLLQPLISAITYVAPIAKRFFQGLIIGALLITTAFLSVRKVWRKVFGGTEINSVYLMRSALIAGAGVAAVLAGALALLLVPLAAFGLTVYRAVQLASLFWSTLGKGYDLVKSIKWKELGSSIVTGIVNGVKVAASWLINTLSDLGTKALGALKSKLGIASPSKAFARLGVAIPQGVQAGVESGTPGAHRAVASMVDVPSTPSGGRERGGAKGGGAQTARGGVTNTVNVGGIHITTAEGAGKPEILADLEQEIQRVFERALLHLGGPTPVIE